MKSTLDIGFSVWILAQGLCMIPALMGVMLFPLIAAILILGGIPALFGFMMYDAFIETFHAPRKVNIALLIVGHALITYLNGLFISSLLAQGSSGDFEFFSNLSFIPATAAIIATAIRIPRYFPVEEEVEQTNNSNLELSNEQ